MFEKKDEVVKGKKPKKIKEEKLVEVIKEPSSSKEMIEKIIRKASSNTKCACSGAVVVTRNRRGLSKVCADCGLAKNS